jgi:glycosyltransferase involved in cell wall biosynthesis
LVEPLARTPGNESGLGGRHPGHRTGRTGLEGDFSSVSALVLFLHNRYRTTGGEERVVDDLLWLVRERLGEDAELLARDSAALGRARAATALLGGGLAPDDVAAAVRRTGARVVHAHNLLPAFGWRALAAAREAGARVVLHLHNYRLVCAVGTCFTRGEDCTRCHGRHTLPGVRLNCRGTGPEAAVYGAALALWQRRLIEQADRVVVPSAFAAARLRTLGAPLDDEPAVVAHLVREIAPAPRFDPAGPALVASRLAPEKGVDLAIDACRAAGIPLVVAGDGAGIPLVVAGDGPQRAALEARAAGADVRFAGRVDPAELDRLRAAETFGLAATEAMAAGLPLLATRAGALAELVDPAQLVEADAQNLAAALAEPPGIAEATANLDRVRDRCAPEVVGAGLREIYAM